MTDGDTQSKNEKAEIKGKWTITKLFTNLSRNLRNVW